MGILNITPDSFSDGGRLMGRADEAVWTLPDIDKVLRTGQAMLEAGASILDVGGESTRPGAQPVPAGRECERVIPVVEALRRLDTIVSVDTSSPLVAREAIAAGAHLINDVRALQAPGMIDAVIESDVAVCVMHMLGDPRTMQECPHYEDVLLEVRTFLAERVRRCRTAGIASERIAVDPGFGFGKTLDHNLELLRRLPELTADDALTGLPVLVGLSRKGMIGLVTDLPLEERDPPSAVAAALAMTNGARIVRAHNVGQTCAALKIVRALGLA